MLSCIVEPFFEAFFAGNIYAFQKILIPNGRIRDIADIHIHIFQYQADKSRVGFDQGHAHRQSNAPETMKFAPQACLSLG